MSLDIMFQYTDIFYYLLSFLILCFTKTYKKASFQLTALNDTKQDNALKVKSPGARNDDTKL